MLKQMLKIDSQISNWDAIQKALLEEEKSINQAKEEQKSLASDLAISIEDEINCFKKDKRKENLRKKGRP